MSDESTAVPPPASKPHRVSAPLANALQQRYEIIRETGRGASAIVYLARDLKHERLVALKTLNPDVGPVAGERFLREIQVSAGMQHPHILPTYDSGVADGRLYFVMPFVDGGSLRERLDAEPQMPIEEALQCAHDIALALGFAHDQGVVHRDIKPENIMFYHGHACLADFGVARVMQELDVRVTGHGMVVGTPAYMSPEQLTDGGFDGRSDVYSLACVLYEMIAGVHAFSGSTPRELLQKRLRTPPDPLHKHRPNAPQFVEDLLLRALSASPDGRFTDARAFAEAIEFALKDIATPKRISGPRRAIQSVPRHPMAWAGSVALIVAVGALAATPLRTVVKNRMSAYDAGKAALDRWDLAAAESELSRAASGDPKMAVAQLRLAQTLELERRVDSDPFRLAAARLAPVIGTLKGRDSLMAEAMIALAARAYPRACDTFEKLRASDSLDAHAWYGLGDCMALDSAVVPDASSPSKLRFRSSWHSAARAYMRAATIDPGAYRAMSYTMLAKLLPSSPLEVRIGRPADSLRMAYAAYPSLSGDSVLFVPFTLAEFAAAAPRVVPPSQPEALSRNRDQLVRFGRAWTAAEPQNADAYEALASGREARGEISNVDGAGSAIARARSLSRSATQQVRLATIEARLRVKRGEFAQARSLADSLLGAAKVATLTPIEAERLAGLAAMTGRIALGGQLRAKSIGGPNADAGIAPPVTELSSRLFIRAAVGVCDDSLNVLKQEIDRTLDSYSQPARRSDVRQAVLMRPMSLAYACTGAKGLEGLRATMPVERAQFAYGRGDRRAVIAILDSAQVVRRVNRPGDVALDFTVQEAWLRSAAGDTAGAVRQLDLVLNALPTLGPWAVREEAQAAAIPRALLLRAELADRAHDVVQRRRRATEALALLQHADPSLAPSIERLRLLASASR